jgi:hypothetical protein
LQREARKYCTLQRVAPKPVESSSGGGGRQAVAAGRRARSLHIATPVTGGVFRPIVIVFDFNRLEGTRTMARRLLRSLVSFVPPCITGGGAPQALVFCSNPGKSLAHRGPSVEGLFFCIGEAR